MKKLALLTLFIFVAMPLAVSAAPFETTFTNFWFLGDFHTYDYASHVDLEQTWIGTSSLFDNSFSWQHSLPGNLDPNGVQRARLWIDAAFVGSNGNTIDINGIMEWDPLSHSWLDNTTYDLTDITDVDQLGFWDNGVIDVTVLAGESSIRLDQAMLLLDYSPASGGQPTHDFSSVPEPSSLALLGIGLAGIVAFRRKRK